MRLTGPEIQALASYLNDVDIAIPVRQRTADFSSALTVIEEMKARPKSARLNLQWPARLASGVKHKAGSTGDDHSEHFVWGPGGDLEYPHRDRRTSGTSTSPTTSRLIVPGRCRRTTWS
ncbi:hypothetical protein GCM10022247_04190 [Allokutzneria multivorans]|uniref:Uncharacterized protein n=1 Tax=Allokutzneria multivorans TaxID=1142134 RepID=A0ABP7QVU2_9PSEU